RSAKTREVSKRPSPSLSSSSFTRQVRVPAVISAYKSNPDDSDTNNRPRSSKAPNIGKTTCSLPATCSRTKSGGTWNAGEGDATADAIAPAAMAAKTSETADRRTRPLGQLRTLCDAERIQFASIPLTLILSPKG